MTAKTFSGIDADLWHERLDMLQDLHVRPLTAYVQELIRRTGAAPFFDPLDGGCEAKVLILLESPANITSQPRLVSRDNPVPTQRNLKRFLAEAGLPRCESVLWNVYPWLADSASGRQHRLSNRDIDRGVAELTTLLDLLPKLRVIVLAGRKAQRALPTLRKVPTAASILSMPHPSPLSVCTSQHVGPDIVRTLAHATKLALLPTVAPKISG